MIPQPLLMFRNLQNARMALNGDTCSIPRHLSWHKKFQRFMTFWRFLKRKKNLKCFALPFPSRLFELLYSRQHWPVWWFTLENGDETCRCFHRRFGVHRGDHVAPWLLVFASMLHGQSVKEFKKLKGFKWHRSAAKHKTTPKLSPLLANNSYIQNDADTQTTYYLVGHPIVFWSRKKQN